MEQKGPMHYRQIQLVLIAAMLMVEGSTIAPQTYFPQTPQPSTPSPWWTQSPLTARVKTAAPTTAAPSIPVVSSPTAPTTDPRCPTYVGTSANLLDYDVPLACPGPQGCAKELCRCCAGHFNDTTFQCYAGPLVSAVYFQSCAAVYMQCMVESASALAANPSRLRKCDSYAVALTREYDTFYGSLDKTATALYKGCQAVLCNFGWWLAASPVNSASACLLAQAAPPFTKLPPATAAPTRMTCPTTIFLNFYSTYVPYMQCGKSLKACYEAFCSCIGGTFVASVGVCNEGLNMTDVVAAEGCMAIAMRCILDTALALYVPMTSTSSADVCTRWPAQMAKAYSALYFQGASELVMGCYAVACTTLATLYTGSINYSFACTFAATSAPLYVAPVLYTCPDGTKVATAADCACIQGTSQFIAVALFSYGLSTFSRDNEFSATSLTAYRGTGGCASSTAFEAFLSFQWTVFNFSNHVIASSSSRTLFLPRRFFASGFTYRLNIRVFGLSATAVFEDTRVFSVATSQPYVTFKLGSAVRASASTGVALVAVVAAEFGQLPGWTYLWTCAVSSDGATCPRLINANTSTAAVPAGSSIGTFWLTLSFRTAFTAWESQTMVLTLLPTVVPLAQLVVTSFPFASPNMYLPSQSVVMTAVYSAFTGAVRYEWTVDGTLVASNRTMSVLLANFSNGSYVVSVRVISAADASNYGEAVTTIVVLRPDIAMTLSASCITCAPGTLPLGLSDVLYFVVTGLDLSRVHPRISNCNLELSFSYFWKGEHLLPVTRGGTGFTYTATAPLMPGLPTLDGVVVKFRATLLLNGIVGATSANSLFSIATPSVYDVINQYMISIQNVNDVSAALDAATTFETLMNSTQTSAVTQKQLAATAVSAIVSTTRDNAGTLPLTQQRQLFSVLSTSLRTQNDDVTGRKVMSEAVIDVLKMVITSATYSLDASSAALGALDGCDPTVAGDVLATFGMTVAQHPNLASGTQLTLSSGNLTVTALKDTVDGLAGSPIATPIATITIPSEALAGLSSVDLVGVAVTSSVVNPFAKDGSSDPAGSIVTVDLVWNSVRQIVSGLASVGPITIRLPASGGSTAAKVCKYFDTTSGKWSTEGVSTVLHDDGSLTCLTTHLSSFAPFVLLGNSTTLVAPSVSTLSVGASVGAGVGGALGGIAVVALVSFLLCRPVASDGVTPMKDSPATVYAAETVACPIPAVPQDSVIGMVEEPDRQTWHVVEVAREEWRGGKDIGPATTEEAVISVSAPLAWTSPPQAPPSAPRSAEVSDASKARRKAEPMPSMMPSQAISQSLFGHGLIGELPGNGTVREKTVMLNDEELVECLGVVASGDRSSIEQMVAESLVYACATGKKVLSLLQDETTFNPLCAVAEGIRFLGRVTEPPTNRTLGLLSQICRMAASVSASKVASQQLAQRLVDIHPIYAALRRHHHVTMNEVLHQQLDAVLHMTIKFLGRHLAPPLVSVSDEQNETVMQWAHRMEDDVTQSFADCEALHHNLTATLEAIKDAIGTHAALEHKVHQPTRQEIRRAFAGEHRLSSSAAAVAIGDLQYQQLIDQLMFVDGARDVIISGVHLEDDSRTTSRTVSTMSNDGTVRRATFAERACVAIAQKVTCSQDACAVVRDATILTSMKHYPNIVQCYGLYKKDSQWYLVTERCDMDLRQAMKTVGAFPIALTAAIGLQIGGALNVLHELGVVHRSTLLLEDVVVGGTTQAPICKLALDNASKSPCTKSCSAAPTAIDLGSRQPCASAKCDVFRLGVLLYQLSTGMPFANENMQQRPQLPPQWPLSFSNLISQLWDPSPERRPIMKDAMKVLIGHVEGEKGLTELRSCVQRLSEQRTCIDNVSRFAADPDGHTVDSSAVTNGDSGRLRVTSDETLYEVDNVQEMEADFVGG